MNLKGHGFVPKILEKEVMPIQSCPECCRFGFGSAQRRGSGIRGNAFLAGRGEHDVGSVILSIANFNSIKVKHD